MGLLFAGNGKFIQNLNMKNTLLKFLLKLAGKPNLQLNKQIDFMYLLGVCQKYGFMLLRGKFTALGHSKISNSIFVGKNVSLISKRNMTLGKRVKLHDNVKIDALSTEGVNLGNDVIIGRNTCIECTGSLEFIGKGVKIGDRTSFGNDCFFGAAGGISIGKDVIAGQYIRFHSENHNYTDLNKLIRTQGVTHKGIKIGDNCWISAGAVFLDGSGCGNGCVIAANSVVTKHFPDNCVIAGVPAKIIKRRE